MMIWSFILLMDCQGIDPLKQTLRTHRDLKFHELVSILKAEEHQSRKGKAKVEDGTSSVFLATQKLQDLSISGASSSTQTNGNIGSISAQTHPILPTPTPMFQSFQSQVPQSFQVIQPQPSQVPMYQPVFSQAPAYFPQSNSRFNGNNRNRPRGQGFVSFPWPACQICGKDNHSARTCYYRNTQTSGFPLGFAGSNMPPGFAGAGMPPSFTGVGTGFQNPHMWRPTVSPSGQMPFQVSMPFAP